MNLRAILEPLENAFLLGGVAGYLGAMLCFWAQLFFRPDDLSPRSEAWHAASGRTGRTLLALGAALHLLALIGQGSALFLVGVGVAGLFGWVLAVACLLISSRLGRDTLGAFITPVALLAALYSLTARDLHRLARPEALETQWQIFHVVLIVIGYVALAFAFAASLIYLIQENLLKRKQLGGLWQRLPSLHVADEIIFRATSFGLAMLTLGLFIGVVWQQKYHPDYAPLHDPKVIFSALTWLIFAIYLASRTWLGWRGRRNNLVVVGGFLMLVISFFGAPHVLSGVRNDDAALKTGREYSP